MSFWQGARPPARRPALKGGAKTSASPLKRAVRGDCPQQPQPPSGGLITLAPSFQGGANEGQHTVIMGTNLDLATANPSTGMRLASRYDTLKIVQVVPSIEEHPGGPSYSVPALCRALAEPPPRASLPVLAPAPS